MSVNPEFNESMQFGPAGSHTLRLQTQYPVIAASHLRLRPFTLFDISRLVRLVATHRIADATLAVPQPFDASQARQWIDSHTVEWRKRSAVHWAVADIDNDWLGGYVGLHDIQLERGQASLSFWIAERISRKDLAIEAAQAALAFAFASLQLDIVQAHQLPGNPLVTQILRRLGMKPDALAPRAASQCGRNEDVLTWLVSRANWIVSLQDKTAH